MLIRTLLIIIFLSTKVFANDSGIIWGQGHLYSLKPPKGWKLDNVSGNKRGLPAVFYPVGGSWANSKAVMYANVAGKKSGQNNIKELIDNYLVTLKAKSPNVKVKDLETVTVGEKTVVIKEWLNNMNNHEAVAYIEESKVIVLLVLTSQDKFEYTKSFTAFRELIGSYNFYSDNPDYKAVSDSQLKPLIKTAKNHSTTERGNEYEKQITKTLGSHMGVVLRGCAEHLKKMDDIDVFFQVSKLGISTKVYWSNNDTTQCFMQNGILSWVFPEPPIDRYHFHIAIKMKP